MRDCSNAQEQISSRIIRKWGSVDLSPTYCVQGTENDSPVFSCVARIVDLHAVIEGFPCHALTAVAGLHQGCVRAPNCGSLPQEAFVEFVSLLLCVDPKDNREDEIQDKVDPNDDENEKEQEGRLVLAVSRKHYRRVVARRDQDE